MHSLCVGDVEVRGRRFRARVRWRTDFPTSLGVDQAMGEDRRTGLSVLGPPGLGAPNEHDAHDSGRTCFSGNTPIEDLWDYIWRRHMTIL